MVSLIRGINRVALHSSFKHLKGRLLQKNVVLLPGFGRSMHLMKSCRLELQRKSQQLLRPQFTISTRKISTNRDLSLMAAFYKKIADIYSSSVDSRSYLQLLSNGIYLPLDLYSSRPPRSPTNPQGDVTTTEEFSQLASMTFDLDGRLTDTKVERAYGVIIKGASSEQPRDSTSEETLNKIRNLLYVKVIDPLTGKKVINDSVLYARYKQSMQAYQLTLAKIQAAKFNYDFSSEEARKQWEVDNIEFQEKLLETEMTLKTETGVANSLIYLSTAADSAVQYVIDTARDNFDNSTLRAQVDGLPYHIAYGIPSTWHSDPNLFSRITITEKDENDTVPFASKYYPGLMAFKNGIFSLNPSLEEPNPENRRKLTSKNIKYQFDIATVAIQRPWLDSTLFSLRKWHVNGFAAGKISKGVLPVKDPNLRNRTLPYYSTAFVIARNVEISGTWSSEDNRILNSSTQPGSSVSMGPFILSGNDASPLVTPPFTTRNENGTFKIPGTQIIGVINTVLPFSAPDPG